MTNRSWLVTSCKTKFYPFAPKASDISICDIARTHACQTRWNGQTGFYSIAQHDVMVSRIVEEIEPELALEGFCHDFAEAYTGDIATPTKMGLPDFKRMETHIEFVIAEKFGLAYPWPAAIKDADTIALVTEAAMLFGESLDWVSNNIFGIKDIDHIIPRFDLWEPPWSPDESEVRFYRRWHELTEK